ncbi:polysaccharide deacetylase family protein [Actinomadura parmotrematis]|uniref:Polysaccharide deacetylase family protein n=1 Tax=Actinomadura parmotrematis TaxID=2864039 RepID=A0ABS7FVL4_9ACTN|nr:polysaccharide deacetylase family protein [Actinomadura parmotrematis]MBW8484457.1 polysaccharide deacetylase family protein [Actinomadura parmotrematis]
MNPIPVLMYHSVHPRPPRATAALSVHPRAFADQMGLLRERGFTPVPFSALGDGPVPPRPVVVTFDDGYADFHRHALPVLDDLGFTATVFATTGWLADAGPDAAGRPLDAMLSWGQVREAAEHGVEFGAHSHSHPQLDQLGGAALRDELARSRGLLEDRLGRAVTTMAYPYGYSSARVRRAVRAAGYGSACAVANRTASLDARGDPLAVPRLTVGRGTSLDTFARVVDGAGLGRVYLREHALTKGYAVVRRARYGVRAGLRKAAGRD